LVSNRYHLGVGGYAPSLGWLSVDGDPVPFGSTAAHDTIPIAREVWARRRPPGATNIS